MNVLASTAAGYIKMQKRHTALTVVGIILSVVLMTVILISASTVLKTVRNITEYTDGTYDVIFNELDKDSVIALNNMDIFETRCLYSISSYTDAVRSDLGEYSSVRYLADKDGNLISDSFLRLGTEGLDMMPSEMTALIDGRLPVKDGEIALSEADAELFGNISVGDTISFARYGVENKITPDSEDISVDDDLSLRGYVIPEQLISHYRITEGKIITFEVVGITSKTGAVFYGDTVMKSFVKEKDKLLLRFGSEQYDYYWDLHYAFQDKGLEINDFDYAMNQQYLNLSGRGVTAKSFSTVLYALLYLVILFIMFCVRMVIDNSFEISSHERIRQYGVIRAVGASKKQILGMLVCEALILSAVGVPAGILIGTGTSFILYLIIGANQTLSSLVEGVSLSDMLEFCAPWWVFASSAFIGVFWVLISAIGTGMRVNKFSPVEAMSSASKKIKLGRPERKAKEGKGGVEWLIAFRSIRRNNKRFLITLVSMAISVVMYAGFSYAAEVCENSYFDEYSESKKPYGFELNLIDTESENTAKEAAEMEKSGHFENIQYDSYLVFFTVSDDNTSSNERIAGIYYMNVHPINANTYKRLTGKDDFDDFEKSGGVIINTEVHNNESDNGETYELYSVLPKSILSSIMVDYTNYDPLSFPLHGSFRTDMDIYKSYTGRITGCIAEKNFDNIVSQIGADSASIYGGDLNGERAYLYPRTIYADAKEGDYKGALNWLNRHYYDYFTDNYRKAESSGAVLELAKLCGYILIVLFTLIAAVNIINIISTNVLNRTSEIGMLRACGMSSFQIYKMVASESVLYAGIASISAALVIEGVVAIVWAPFYFQLGPFRQADLPVTLSFFEPIKYLIIGAVGAFIIGAAAVIPAAGRIIKTPIIDAVEKIN